MIFFLGASAIFTPVYISFASDHSNFFDNLNLAIDIVFGIDICINFLSAYNDPNKNIVENFKLIALRYLRLWFWIDAFAIFPFDDILHTDSDTDIQRLHSLSRLLRFPKLYRLSKHLKIVRKKLFIENYYYTRFIKKLLLNIGFLKIIKIIIKFAFLNHLAGCLWFYIARIQGFSPDTWVERDQLTDQDESTQYIASIYWSLQTLTTVGYGDITTENAFEIFLSNIWMIIGVLVYSFIIGSLYTIILSFNMRSESLKEQIRTFDVFASQVDLPGFIQQNVRRYFEINHKENVYYSMDPKSFMKSLPVNLKTSVLLFSYYKLIQNIKFLQINPNLTASLIVHFKIIKLKDQEVLYREDDPAREIYFISQGCVRFMVQGSKGVYSLSDGTYFGDFEVFDGIKRQTFCQAVGQTVIIICPMKAFLDELKEFPDIEAQMRKIALIRATQFAKKIGMIRDGKVKATIARTDHKFQTLLQTTDYMNKVLLNHYELKENEAARRKHGIRLTKYRPKRGSGSQRKSIRGSTRKESFSSSSNTSRSRRSISDRKKLTVKQAEKKITFALPKPKEEENRKKSLMGSLLGWKKSTVKTIGKAENKQEKKDYKKSSSIESLLKDNSHSITKLMATSSITASRNQNDNLLDQVEIGTTTFTSVSPLITKPIFLRGEETEEEVKEKISRPRLESRKESIIKTQSLNLAQKPILYNSNLVSLVKGKTTVGIPSRRSKVMPVIEDEFDIEQND